MSFFSGRPARAIETLLASPGVLALVALLAVIAPIAVSAQHTGAISGIVRDGLLRPIATAQVTLSTRAATRTVFTDENGAFRFDRVPDGRAVVFARRAGYAAIQRYEATVTGGSNHKFEILLYERSAIGEGKVDPRFNTPADFTDPRGLAFGIAVGYAASEMSIGTSSVSGKATTARLESVFEFDKHWTVGVRTGLLSGAASDQVSIAVNQNSSLAFRDYSLPKLEATIRYLPFSSRYWFRPWVGGSFGAASFSGEIAVNSIASPVHARGRGTVSALSAGAQIELKYNLAADIGIERSRASLEGWRFDGDGLALPNLRLTGKDITVAVRWWPWARW